MADTIYSQLHSKLLRTVLLLLFIIAAGTTGYWFIGARHYSLVDCLYMTFITITTIGFSEVIDMSGNPGGRLFTIVVAISGISTATYIFTNLTAFMVEGELNKAFRRRKMEKLIKKLRAHYIICGVERVGAYIVNELAETKRPYVMVDIDKVNIEKLVETFRDALFVEGDATNSDTLMAAGITGAKGLFAATGDDNVNLVISLTAKQLNPELRVVAGCKDLKNMEKIRKAGADAVVSSTSIGGMRMASEMVRSTVVSFLDTMLRDKEKNLRIEEITAPPTFAGKPLSELEIRKRPHILLLAVKSEDGWVYNPPETYSMKLGDILIFLTTPEERSELESIFQE
jgi:voltage-gated potassium channel